VLLLLWGGRGGSGAGSGGSGRWNRFSLLSEPQSGFFSAEVRGGGAVGGGYAGLR